MINARIVLDDLNSSECYKSGFEIYFAFHASEKIVNKTVNGAFTMIAHDREFISRVGTVCLTRNITSHHTCTFANGITICVRRAFVKAQLLHNLPDEVEWVFV